MKLFQWLRNHRLLGVVFLTSLTFCLWVSHVVPLVLKPVGLGVVAIAQSPDVERGKTKELLQRGIESYLSGDLQSAIQLWEVLKDSKKPSPEVLTSWKYLVKAYQEVGRVEQAIVILNQLVAYYQKVGHLQQVGRMLTEQAQVYSSLGQNSRAITLLCGENHMNKTACAVNSAIAIAQKQGDTLGEAAALGSLGNAYRLQGNYEQALQYLETALKLAEKIDNKLYIVAAQNNLGSTYASLAKQEYRRLEFARQTDDSVAIKKLTQNALAYDRQAIQHFKQSLTLAQKGDPHNEIRSLLNLVVSYHRSQRGQEFSSPPLPTEPIATLKSALNLLEHLPDSRSKAYTAIRLANLFQWVTLHTTYTESDSVTRCLTREVPSTVVKLLQQALAIANRIQDNSAAAFAFGRLGHIYECQQNYKLALKLTQQAQLATQNQENRYLWEWQVGRIIKAQGKIPEAISAYKMAIQTLKSIRNDITIAGRDFQLDFRDAVEPVYRELALSQLEQATKESQKSNFLSPLLPIPSSSFIESALETIDSLHLAELQNYLGNNCLPEVAPTPITLSDEKTAVISSIIFPDRVAVILTLPNKEKQLRNLIHWISQSATEVTTQVNELRQRLEKRSDRANTYTEPTQQLYDWLIKPFVAEITRAKIETLVFVHDGILRSIPMAALYDGNQFLVEQYSIANNPSLKLVAPKRLDKLNLSVIAFGLTQPSVVEGSTFFEPLSYVEQEIDQIIKTVPNSKGILDREFTQTRLQQELQQNNFPIIHIATHGKFGIDAQETFLVVGENEKLTISQLYQIIRNRSQVKSLELLTLTACETAVGSDRHALGIAGISLQAGARSAVASLWQVDDLATSQIITRFYQNLQSGMSRAKSLQLAQKSWLKQHQGTTAHPSYWAALILVGNWF